MSEELISPERAANDLLAAAAYLAQHIKNSDAHAEAMKAVVPRYLNRGEVDVAAELSNTIDDPYTRDRLLILVAEKCAEIGDDEYGLQLADAIEDIGMQSQARERVAIKKAIYGEFEKASDIAAHVLHADYVYAEIAVGLAKAGRYQEAGETLNKIELPVARASALQGIAVWDLENGNAERAAESLERAVAAAKEIEHGEEKIRTLGEIANAFTEAGRNDLSVETYEFAKDEAAILTSIHRDVFLSGIAIGLLKAGNLQLADEALDLVGDKTQMASGLIGLARLFWASGEKDEAMEALEESYSIIKSQAEAETRDSRAKFKLHAMIAVQFAVFGKAERAIEIAQENPDENERMSALAQIAQTLTMQGDDDLARQAIHAIDEDANRMFALIGMSEAKNNAGEKGNAIELLGEAAGLAETVPQLASRSAAYNEIARRLNDLGETEKAREISHQNLDLIFAIRSESSRTTALSDLAELYHEAKFDLTDPAKEIIHTMLVRATW